MVVVEREGAEFYVDNTLSRELEKVRNKVKKKDEDYFFCVDGEEGAGKSVFALQLAKFLDPSFNLDRVVFNAKDFQKAILRANKGECVVFDEAFRGLSSRGALSEVNKLLVSLMMECRQKNLFVIIVLPTFFLLDKYVALWRAKGLFHIYRSGGKRGFWMFFNKKKKKLLYLKGKSTYSYSYPKSGFLGRFYEYYPVDEKEYRNKKSEALKNTDRNTRAQNYMVERNILLWYLYNEKQVTHEEIARRMSELGWGVERSTITKAISKCERRLKKQGIIL